MTPEKIAKFCPAAAPYAAGLIEGAAKFGIVTPLEWAHFMAQASHESGGFKRFTEGLNYSAEGLQKTWPNRFNAATAAQYARQPEKIANKVYADRMGNGPEASGDGWKYIGRAPIQLTGKDNYAACSKALFGDDRLVRDPSALLDPKTGAMSAAWFFAAHSAALRWARADDVVKVTKAINGGSHGIEDRQALTKVAKGIFV